MESIAIATAPSEKAIALAHPHYRRDIDGLRAVAVLSVVGFHGFPQWFNGGFVGVDIFFVISGYLITGIVRRELQDGHFSLTNFYARRIRRIFPALFVVLAVCSVAAGLCHPLDTRIASYSLGLMIESVGYSWLVSGFEPWSGGFELERVVQQLTDLWCRAAYKDGVADLVAPRSS